MSIFNVDCPLTHAEIVSVEGPQTKRAGPLKALLAVVVERLLGVVSASLDPNEHVVEVLLPVDTFEVLPPKAQSRRVVCVSLHRISICRWRISSLQDLQHRKRRE